MESAPFHNDLAEGPEGGRTVWSVAEDGVRLRLGWWPAAQAQGTVLLFPGRSEYIEKYGRVARDITAAGLTVACIDWRGQGLSDRVARDPRVGHVVNFLDYQKDVSVLVDLATKADLPRPWFLLAHSMGGCIGYRALTQGLDVARAVFSAPMWGIQMPPPVKPLAHILPPLAKAVGAGETFAPGTKPANYITDTGFQENTLTTCRSTYEWMGKHAAMVDEFALGGPSVHWVGEATKETRALPALPRPALPVRTYLGTEEAIVSAEAIRRLHVDWPSADLVVIDGAKHEIMMEAPAHRDRFIDETISFFTP